LVAVVVEAAVVAEPAADRTMSIQRAAKLKQKCENPSCRESLEDETM
jgi:hypothetical protein